MSMDKISEAILDKVKAEAQEIIKGAEEEAKERVDKAREQYEAKRTIRRQIDRDQDGVRDAFFYYQGDLLVMDEQDIDGDGSIDVRSFYEEGQLVRREVLNPEFF